MNYRSCVHDAMQMVTLNVPTIVAYHSRHAAMPSTTVATIQMNRLNYALSYHSVPVLKVSFNVATNAVLNPIGNVITQTTAVTTQTRTRVPIMTAAQTNSNAVQVIALHKASVAMASAIV